MSNTLISKLALEGVEVREAGFTHVLPSHPIHGFSLITFFTDIPAELIQTYSLIEKEREITILHCSAEGRLRPWREAAAELLSLHEKVRERVDEVRREKTEKEYAQSTIYTTRHKLKDVVKRLAAGNLTIDQHAKLLSLRKKYEKILATEVKVVEESEITTAAMETAMVGNPEIKPLTPEEAARLYEARKEGGEI